MKRSIHFAATSGKPLFAGSGVKVADRDVGSGGLEKRMKEQPPSGEAVSLIIPTLRRPEHLARCLASLVPQTLQATEVLVGIRADDRSNEETIERFKDRLPVRKVEAKGVGVVGSMNSCLREANGDYIALLDDDIELPPNWIERMVGHLRGRPDVYAAG